MTCAGCGVEFDEKALAADVGRRCSACGVEFDDKALAGTRCPACGEELDRRVLAPDVGRRCFECEQGSHDGVPDRNNGIELAKSIVEGLAAKKKIDSTGIDGAGQAVANADFMNKVEDREAADRDRRRRGGGMVN